jgi:hypothetical protein
MSPNTPQNQPDAEQDARRIDELNSPAHDYRGFELDRDSFSFWRRPTILPVDTPVQRKRKIFSWISFDYWLHGDAATYCFVISVNWLIV